MAIDRRHYRRLNAPVYWRVSGLRTALMPVDVSIGGMRMYSDDPVEVGGRIELELFGPGDEPLELVARVVWVESLGADAPALYDVGLEFLELSAAAREHIAGLLQE